MSVAFFRLSGEVWGVVLSSPVMKLPTLRVVDVDAHANALFRLAAKQGLLELVNVNDTRYYYTSSHLLPGLLAKADARESLSRCKHQSQAHPSIHSYFKITKTMQDANEGAAQQPNLVIIMNEAREQ